MIQRVLRLELTRNKALLALKLHLSTFEEEDYSVNNWGRVVVYFEAGLASVYEAESVDGVDEALERAKENMSGVPFENFLFRIVEEEITVYYGEDIWVNVEFVNQMGRVVWVSSEWFFEVYVPEYTEFLSESISPPYGYAVFLKNKESIRNNYWGDYPKIRICSSWGISRGTHELSFRFDFFAFGEKLEWDFDQLLFMGRKWTNTITLTVI